MLPDCVTTLLGIQGFRVKTVELIGNLPGRSTVCVHLERAREGYVCGKCRRAVTGGYDHSTQEPFFFTRPGASFDARCSPSGSSHRTVYDLSTSQR